MALCNYSCNSLCGIDTACVSQIPASEVVIQPPPVCITMPGPIMSASSEPVAVAGNTPCASAGCYEPCGYGYGGACGYGYGSGRWRSGSACCYPYYSRYGSRSCY